MMINRQNLIFDFEKFDNEIQNQEIGPKWSFKKSDYLDLINRTLALTVTDFENQNKYNFFLKFITDKKIKDNIKYIENSFENNHLEKHGMLLMGDLFLAIVRKLK